ncbi:Protein of unknown function, partial [Gryllus bimaculatus]
MCAENRSSKPFTAPILKWQLINEESDDEHSFQAGLNQRKQNDDGDTHPNEHDSDSTFSRDEFSTDVIPASFSNLNVNKDHIDIPQTAHKPNKEFLEEVESISSDLTDSLIISPKPNSANNSQENEFQNKKPVSQERSRCSVKRNRSISPIFFHKRKKIDKSQEFSYDQPIKQNCNIYANIDALVRKLKHTDKLSLKDRKRATSKMRRALTDIRNETESMLQGMTPVPNKMHIKMQLMRSQKLCDHLIALYEDFPSNSQKMLLEEVCQVRETIQCELKGILELMNYSEISAKRLIHKGNNTASSESDTTGTYPMSSELTKQLLTKQKGQERHHGENEEYTPPEDQ